MTITVCIGSGCHVKGSREIINFLEQYIRKNNLKTELELEACFCQGNCTEGVVIKFNDELVTGVTKENIISLLKEKLKGEVL